MEYIITSDVKVTVDESGQMSARDLSRTMMILAGHKLVLEKDGFDIFTGFGQADDSTQLALIYDNNIDIAALESEHSVIAYSPLADPAISQKLMLEFKINVSAIITTGGNFSPAWKADRLGAYMALDQRYTDLLGSLEEPLNVVHQNPFAAVGFCAALAVGIGRTTFVVFDEVGNARLIYLSQENVPTLFNKGFGKTIFPVPELDSYIVSGAPEKAFSDAVSRARLDFEAAKTQQEEKDSQDQSDAEVKQDEQLVTDAETKQETHEPEKAPEISPAPTPVVNESAQDSELKPEVDPTPEPVNDAAPEPTPEPAAVAEPEPEPEREPTPAPVAEPTSETAPQPVAAVEPAPSVESTTAVEPAQTPAPAVDA